jgi:regulator of sigma E protease
MILSALAIALVLGGLIFFHELGHFIVARAFGVGVTTFSLGFGPTLFGIQRGRTMYKVSAVPLGGYVDMVGEQPGQALPEGFGREDSFNSRGPLQRMAIVAAGPGFNLLLAVILYYAIFLSQGQPAFLPVVGGVLDDSPAMTAGIETGDRVLAIDGEAVEYWEDMVGRIVGSDGRSLELTVLRQDEELKLNLTPEIKVRKNIFGEEISVPMIGISSAGELVYIPLDGGSALSAALNQTWTAMTLTVQAIVKLVERVIPAETIGGPIMIAQLVSQQAHEGLINVLSLAAFISINLGMLNLMPIPVLDGGHLLFFAIEAITGRPLSERWQAITIRIGLSLLLALMAFAIYNDLARIARDGF